MNATTLTRSAARAWARLRRRPTNPISPAYADFSSLPPRPAPISLDPADLPAINCPCCGHPPISGTEQPRTLPTASRRFNLTCGGCATTYVETEPRPITYMPDDYDQCPSCGNPPTSGTIAFRGEGFSELFVRRYDCTPCGRKYVRTTDGS
ncbi:hypothetical protein [Nocardia salmonicida]|uniref:hypothetical protein n=1 Tax=Nocardia salmonicida TaxID=53431 RepID=UPI0007A54D52|nr:hypothetical protein [Nocardia salmonicida]MBC7299520.1 hypothetical protein [Nocardia sp.]